MLRAVFRRRMRDAISGCEVTNQIYTIKVDVPEIENELKRGGFGESGFEIIELVGMEVERPTEFDEMCVEAEQPICPGCGMEHELHLTEVCENINCDCGVKFEAKRKIVTECKQLEYRE